MPAKEIAVEGCTIDMNDGDLDTQFTYAQHAKADGKKVIIGIHVKVSNSSIGGAANQNDGHGEADIPATALNGKADNEPVLRIDDEIDVPCTGTYITPIGVPITVAGTVKAKISDAGQTKAKCT